MSIEDDLSKADAEARRIMGGLDLRALLAEAAAAQRIIDSSIDPSVLRQVKGRAERDREIREVLDAQAKTAWELERKEREREERDARQLELTQASLREMASLATSKKVLVAKVERLEPIVDGLKAQRIVPWLALAVSVGGLVWMVISSS